MSAGTGTTVTGSGSSVNPFVVSADAPACSAVRPCISAGNGAAYSPASGVVSARLSTDAGNLVEFGSDGGLFAETDCTTVRACLSAGENVTYDPVTGVIAATGGGGVVTCDDVRPCISAGQGAAYDPATGIVSARLSADPGNQVSFGGDGGLYADTDCPSVRACLSEGNGADFDPATGVIAARLSTDAGNTAVFGGDGGLFVPPATVTTGCGLTGDGSAATPVTAATSPWTLPCPVDDGAGLVYCDSAGLLRSEPRGQASFQQQFSTTNYADVAVPAGQPTTTIETNTMNIVNPDPCRDAFVITEIELDVDLTLPANSGAIYSMGGDDMVRIENKGTSAMNDVHWQGTKVFNTTIPAGGNINDAIDLRIGGGFGGATYSRIQVAHRAFIFNL